MSLKECASIFDNWVKTDTLPSWDNMSKSQLDEEYQKLREDFIAEYNKQKTLYEKYNLDANMSIWFYKYMNDKTWFCDRLACDEDFWRYIAMNVIPEVITDRWTKSDRRHYYSKGTRIYPYTLYWYAHLSLKSGNIDETKKLLASERLNTDCIVALVERTGRNGTCIELYRHIVDFFCNTDPSKKLDHIHLRRIMKLCMSRIPVMDPDLCPGGSKEYARKLVYDCI